MYLPRYNKKLENLILDVALILETMPAHAKLLTN